MCRGRASHVTVLGRGGGPPTSRPARCIRIFSYYHPPPRPPPDNLGQSVFTHVRASPLNPVAPRRRPVRLQPVLHQPGELLQRATSLLYLKCSPSSCACPVGLRFSLFPVVFQGSPSLLGKGLPCLTPCPQLLPGSSPPSALVPPL